LGKIFDFHADDYAVSVKSSEDIRVLSEEGCLDSISVLPNMSAFDKVQSPASWCVKCSVHLNFMEGHCCSHKEGLPDLVDENGFFKTSWLKLMAASYNPLKRNAVRKQLAEEIIAQIEKCIEAKVIKPQAVRIDSHQHTHMIPVVADALFDSVEKLSAFGIRVEFIRNTEDPVLLYLRSCGALKNVRLANILKCLILNFYSISFKRKLKDAGLPISYLCGVFYSGQMDAERLRIMLPVYERFAEKKNRRVEVLFHPGSVKRCEITEEFVKHGFVEFHLSPDRHIEYESIRLLKGENS